MFETGTVFGLLNFKGVTRIIKEDMETADQLDNLLASVFIEEGIKSELFQGMN